MYTKRIYLAWQALLFLAPVWATQTPTPPAHLATYQQEEIDSTKQAKLHGKTGYYMALLAGATSIALISGGIILVIANKKPVSEKAPNATHVNGFFVDSHKVWLAANDANQKFLNPTIPACSKCEEQNAESKLDIAFCTKGHLLCPSHAHEIVTNQPHQPLCPECQTPFAPQAIQKIKALNHNQAMLPATIGNEQKRVRDHIKKSLKSEKAPNATHVNGFFVDNHKVWPVANDAAQEFLNPTIPACSKCEEQNAESKLDIAFCTKGHLLCPSHAHEIVTNQPYQPLCPECQTPFSPQAIKKIKALHHNQAMIPDSVGNDQKHTRDDIKKNLVHADDVGEYQGVCFTKDYAYATSHDKKIRPTPSDDGDYECNSCYNESDKVQLFMFCDYCNTIYCYNCMQSILGEKGKLCGVCEAQLNENFLKTLSNKNLRDQIHAKQKALKG
ncbi:MAG: hypothetical protein AAF380_01300 [Bacteroidota bacterium]